MELVNIRNGYVLADQVKVADSFLERLLGLIGLNFFPKGSAMVLKPCKAVHTFFMRFSVDVIFLNRTGKVVKILPEVQPLSISPFVKEAWKVVELPGGSVQNLVQNGDILIFAR